MNKDDLEFESAFENQEVYFEIEPKEIPVESQADYELNSEVTQEYPEELAEEYIVEEPLEDEFMPNSFDDNPSELSDDLSETNNHGDNNNAPSDNRRKEEKQSKKSEPTEQSGSSSAEQANNVQKQNPNGEKNSSKSTPEQNSNSTNNNAPKSGDSKNEGKKESQANNNPKENNGERNKKAGSAGSKRATGYNKFNKNNGGGKTGSKKNPIKPGRSGGKRQGVVDKLNPPAKKDGDGEGEKSNKSLNPFKKKEQEKPADKVKSTVKKTIKKIPIGIKIRIIGIGVAAAAFFIIIIIFLSAIKSPYEIIKNTVFKKFFPGLDAPVSVEPGDVKVDDVLDYYIILGSASEYKSDFYISGKAYSYDELRTSIERNVDEFEKLSPFRKKVITSSMMLLGGKYADNEKSTTGMLNDLNPKGLDNIGFLHWIILNGFDIDIVQSDMSEFVLTLKNKQNKSFILIKEDDLMPGDFGITSLNEKIDNNIGIYTGKGNWIHGENEDNGYLISGYNGYKYFFRLKVIG